MNAANFANQPKDIVVIGGGDCAANRVIPALITAGLAPENIHVFALSPSSLEDKLAHVNLHQYFSHDNDDGYTVPDLLNDAQNVAIAKNAPVIIASPSFAHLDYVKEFLGAGLIVGCEKPLTCFPSEIEPFQNILNSNIGNHLFGFSYYALEKGLPLTWLKNPDMKIPEGLLEVVDETGKPLDAETLSQLRTLLEAPVKEIKILLLEGGERSNTNDYRSWTVDPKFGGNPVETGVHPLLLACLAHTLKPADLARLQVTTGLFQGYAADAPATYATYTGQGIALAFGKHIHKDNLYRGGSIDYANGMHVAFDFDKKTLKVSQAGKTKAEIRVTKLQNYAAQVTQFLDFVGKGGWVGGQRHDFAAEQLAVLNQIMQVPVTPHLTYGSGALQQRDSLETINTAPQYDSTHVIKSGNLIVRVNEKGGSLDSIFMTDRHAQIMGQWPSSQGGMTSGFPIGPVVGSVSESGKFIYEGQLFEPGKHGYARKTQFTCIRQTEDSIVLRHIHDPKKLPSVYPFRHQIELEYSINAGMVTSRMSITNLDDRVMYCGGGFHPAFAWPLPGNTSQEGHSLTLLSSTMPEKTAVYRPVDGKAYKGISGANPLAQNKKWYISPKDFAADAFFMIPPEHARPEVTSLRFKGAPEGVSLDISMTGWDGFGVWTKPDGSVPILCVEPLAGVPIINSADEIPELEKIVGLRPILPGQTFTATMGIIPR